MPITNRKISDLIKELQEALEKHGDLDLVYASDDEGIVMLKTSNEWQNEDMDILVIDPDGWDRTNYHYSWFEERITKEEYDRRCLYSTYMSKK